jgi:hypothetical protein
MSYTIEPVDIADPLIDEELILLIKDAFGMEQPITGGHLYRNTVTPAASQRTLFLAAKENGKIIGCNGFMATDFRYNDSVFTCYQSCWSATHPAHQGRKIFVNIINEAKEILRARNAGFIYGVANNNSHPIFIKKLAFKEVPAVMTKVPNLPLVRSSFLTKTSNDLNQFTKNSFLPVEDQIIDLKRAISGGEVIKLNVAESFIWGKIHTKKVYAGLQLRYFYVGGMELCKPEHFKKLVKKICVDYHVHYIQVVSCQINSYNELLKGWKPAQINGFIFFELNSGTIEHANLYYGAIDVF